MLCPEWEAFNSEIETKKSLSVNSLNSMELLFSENYKKKSLGESWNRPERQFFAAGACHILAHVFLEKYPEMGFVPVLIRPKEQMRGSHVFVTDGDYVFDWHGYSHWELFRSHYFNKMQKLFPGWDADLIEIKTSLIEDAFCDKYCHRKPENFFMNPIPRAKAYLERFSSSIKPSAR